jgi:hypothetical protein
MKKGREEKERKAMKMKIGGREKEDRDRRKGEEGR